MLKEFAWKMFEKTGDISMYMFLKEIEEKTRTVDETEIAMDEVAISTHH
ncbi:MAG TPA: YqzL family protein [Acetivibrio sp.]|nr:YqzL family protein [Acetivibrio sp.]